MYYHKQNYEIVKTTNRGFEQDTWEKIEKKKKTKEEAPLIGKCLVKIKKPVN